MSAIKQVEVDERITVDDDRILLIFNKLVKQRKESITQFAAAGRNDLVAQEEFELKLLLNYLPEPLSTVEIEQIITEAINLIQAKNSSDMGKVMNYLKPIVQGKCDMSQVSMLVKSKLD